MKRMPETREMLALRQKRSSAYSQYACGRFWLQRGASHRVSGILAASFIASIFLSALVMPVSVLAADASTGAIMNALSEGVSKGICTPRSDQSSGDCVKTTTTCSPDAWQKYVAANYQNTSGSVSLSSAAPTGGSLKPLSATTQGLSDKATQILAQHKAAFPNCAALCPADMSTCVTGTEYPFTLGGKSYVGRVTVHTNVPGTPNPNGCPHPGVELFEVTGASAGGGSQGTGGSVAYLSADWERNRNLPPGPVERGTCYCKCGGAGDSLSACQGKDPGTPVLTTQERTYEECKSDCGTHEVATDKCRIAPLPGAIAGSTPSNNTALCFTSRDCAEAKGNFESGTGGCGAGQGRCYSPEPIVKLNTPIGSVTEIQGFGNYVATAYRWLLSIVAIAATVMFVWGAFEFLIGSALPSIAHGKAIMIDAVVGMLLVLSATAILRTINPATTHLDPVKTYMVNTRIFLNTVFCKDLPGGIRLANAGKKPNIKTYESLASNESAFSVSPAQAKCGESYWAKDSAGSACDGNVCEIKGEACVSCADGNADKCEGTKSTKMVCQKVIFAGNITYADKRAPEEISLVFLCNGGQPADPANAAPSAVINNWSLGNVNLDKTSFESNGKTSDVDETGQAVYKAQLSTKILDAVKTFCSSRGGLRGAVLGVQYNDDTLSATTRALASAGLAAFGGPVGTIGAIAVVVPPADDFAIVSKQNCRNTNSAFDGYGNGHLARFDTTDVATAMLCGFSHGKLLDGTGVYWKEADLRAALDGSSPIICDFALNHDTAPSDPGQACPVKLQ